MSDAEIITIDVLDWLRGRQWLVQSGFMPRAHAVLCDPPYFLGSISKRFGKPDSAPAKYGTDGAFQRQSRGFMGQSWDGFLSPWHYQAWVTEWATLLLDFVYPGAVGAFFGGTRTFHRLAAGLEDAGWEIFDVIAWVYGSGFPKGHDLSKALDHEAGAEREITGQRISAYGTAEPGRGSRPDGKGGMGLFLEGDPKEVLLREQPATALAAHWQGYNVALKPAYEPVILCRAPRHSATFAQLAREHGTGALNIDGSRIKTDDELKAGGNLRASPADNRNGKALGMFQPGTVNTYEQSAAGRWPANLILGCTCDGDEHREDCAVRVLGEQSGETGNGFRENPSASHYEWFGHHNGTRPARGHDDTGTAARFYYTAKAAAWEREAGLHERAPQTVNDGRQTPIDNPYQRGETQRRNIHPTVKPITLTEYLARLLLPPALSEPRRLLVPFAGVGSEMLGARLAGWDVVIGLERGAEYAAIGRQRLAWWAQFKSYEQAQAAFAADRDEAQIRASESAVGVAQLPLFAEATP